MDSLGNIILYFVVSLAIVIFSLMAVGTRKILRSATYLLFVLIATAIVYFQLGYQFLGAVQIAVYAGGIMVLFVFAILLTHRPDQKTAPLDSHRKVAGVLSAVCGCALLLFALCTMPVVGGMSLTECLTAAEPVTMKEIGHAMLGTERFQYLLPFEAVSVLLLACIIGGVVIARKN